MIRLPSATIVGLVVLVAAAGGVAGALVVLPSGSPAALATGAPTTSVPVTERQDADERQAQLTLETGAPRTVTAHRDGVLTELACSTNGMVRSGEVVARFDGEPVVALATTTPLWRDLAGGDRGTDARALQEELTRLGHPTPNDGVVGPATLRAARGLLRPLGVTVDDTIPLDAFAWVPDDENLVRSCDAAVGTRLEAGAVLAQLPFELRGARIDQLPVDPAAGERVVRVASATALIDSDGVVADPEGLRAIEATAEYAIAVNASESAPSVSATWALRNARAVSVVPPTALWGVAGDHACIAPTDARGTRADPVEVRIVGSQLGQSFVHFPDGATVRYVDPTPTPTPAPPSRTTSCR